MAASWATPRPTSSPANSTSTMPIAPLSASIAAIITALALQCSSARSGCWAYLSTTLRTHPDRLTAKVLLPGLSVLERAVARVRSRVADHLHRRLAERLTPEQRMRLDGILVVPDE